MFTHKEEADIPEFFTFRNFALFNDGTVLPLIRGGAEDDDDDEEDDDEDDKKKKPVTFTQSHVNSLLAKEKRDATKKAVTDLLKKLEVESEDALQTLVDQSRTDGKNESEELTRLRQSESDAKAARKKAEGERDDLKLHARIKDALVEGGLKPKAARKASRLVEVDPEATDDEIVGAVEDLKDDWPELFVADSNNDDDNNEEDDAEQDGGSSKKRKPDSDSGPPPRKQGKQQETDRSKAVARLREQYPDHEFKKSTTGA